MVTRKVLAAFAGAALIVWATGILAPSAAADTISAKARADLGGTVTPDSTCQVHTAARATRST